MKRLIPVAILVAVAAFVAIGLPALALSQETPKANTYRTYTACRAKPDAAPAHRCPQRGTKGAFFRSMDAHVTYKVCVRFPNGKKLCAGHQDAPKGKLRINPITSHMLGEHHVTWFVAGRKVGDRRFTIHSWAPTSNAAGAGV